MSASHLLLLATMTCRQAAAGQCQGRDRHDADGDCDHVHLEDDVRRTVELVELEGRRDRSDRDDDQDDQMEVLAREVKNFDVEQSARQDSQDTEEGSTPPETPLTDRWGALVGLIAEFEWTRSIIAPGAGENTSPRAASDIEALFAALNEEGEDTGPRAANPPDLEPRPTDKFPEAIIAALNGAHEDTRAAESPGADHVAAPPAAHGEEFLTEVGDHRHNVENVGRRRPSDDVDVAAQVSNHGAGMDEDAPSDHEEIRAPKEDPETDDRITTDGAESQRSSDVASSEEGPEEEDVTRPLPSAGATEIDLDDWIQRDRNSEVGGASIAGEEVETSGKKGSSGTSTATAAMTLTVLLAAVAVAL